MSVIPVNLTLKGNLGNCLYVTLLISGSEVRALHGLIIIFNRNRDLRATADESLFLILVSRLLSQGKGEMGMHVKHAPRISAMRCLGRRCWNVITAVNLLSIALEHGPLM